MDDNESHTPDGQNIQETSDVIVPEAKHDTAKVSGLKLNLHGTIYQLKLLILFFVRGLNLGYIFKLKTELEEAGKFNDLVFSYELEGEEKKKYLFLQAKHKQNQKGYITYNNLLSTAQNSPFGLQKYFNSYKNIQNKFKDGLIEFVIYTNFTFNKTIYKKNYLEPLEVNDPLLEVSNGERYKLVVNNPKTSLLYENLKETSDAYLLAKELDVCIWAPKKLALTNLLFKKYHSALVKDVIDVKTRKFKEEFINNTMASGSPMASFRKIFGEEMIRRHKREFSDNDGLVKYLKQIDLYMSENFRKDQGPTEQSLPIDIITEDEIKKFLNKLTFAVNQPNEIDLVKNIQEDLGKTIRKKLGEDFKMSQWDSENVYNSCFVKMLDWFKGKEYQSLSDKDADEMFADILKKLSLINIKEEDCSAE